MGIDTIATRTAFGDLQRVRTAAKQLRRKLGYDTDHPAYIFSEPRFGYRMDAFEHHGFGNVVGRSQRRPH